MSTTNKRMILLGIGAAAALLAALLVGVLIGTSTEPTPEPEEDPDLAFAALLVEQDLGAGLAEASSESAAARRTVDPTNLAASAPSIRNGANLYGELADDLRDEPETQESDLGRDMVAVLDQCRTPTPTWPTRWRQRTQTRGSRPPRK